MASDLEALRDEAARLRGWTSHVVEAETVGGGVAPVRRWTNGEVSGRPHPLPLTLDAVDAAMPKGSLNVFCRDGGWGANWRRSDNSPEALIWSDGPTELHARLALLVAVLKADAGKGLCYPFSTKTCDDPKCTCRNEKAEAKP